jgi:hypothetical protein
MSLFWLVYADDADIAVVILPASALIYARLAAVKAGLDDGTFTESHQLDAKFSKSVPKNVTGRRLTQDEATKLLVKLE